MSFLIVEGLRVQCPECEAVRVVSREGGGAPLQVGDENVRVQMDLQKRTGREGAHLFHLRAWCPACAAPLLTSRPQALATTMENLLEEIHAWSSSLQQKAIERITALSPSASGPSEAADWLKGAFPDLFRECLEDSRCGLYPDYFTKMKKRFKTQAGRCIERDGVPMPRGFKEWLEGEVASHPFAEPMEDLQKEVDSLSMELPGPWSLVEQVDPWQGINLNPYLCCDQTVFIADGEPGAPLHFTYEADPKELPSACQAALRRPSIDPDRFVRNRDVELVLREKVSELVDALTWPIQGNRQR